METVFQKIISFIRELYDTPDEFIPLHAPVFNGNEKKYLEECIDTTFVSSVGKFVDAFEEKMAEYTGATRAVVCVNGTNALHLALLLCGVEPESEVITQPLTFIATANAISYCRAKPVFLDVDMDTMGLSPDSLKQWLAHSTFQKTNQSTGKKEIFNKTTGRRISACVPVHTFGHPCRIDEIVSICEDIQIPVVEDAAESLGSFYKGQHTGTFGKIGVLSFNGNKIVTTGGGGMLLFKDEHLARYAKHLTTQAKKPHKWEFDHDYTGYNFRMPNINAALGLAQLEQINTFLTVKRNIALRYSKFFDEIKSESKIQFFTEPQHAHSNYWLNCIFFENISQRNHFLEYSNERGIMTRPAWKLMNELIMYDGCETDQLINAKQISQCLVNIPSSVKIKKANI